MLPEKAARQLRKWRESDKTTIVDYDILQAVDVLINHVLPEVCECGCPRSMHLNDGLCTSAMWTDKCDCKAYRKKP